MHGPQNGMIARNVFVVTFGALIVANDLFHFGETKTNYNKTNQWDYYHDSANYRIVFNDEGRSGDHGDG